MCVLVTFTSQLKLCDCVHLCVFLQPHVRSLSSSGSGAPYGFTTTPPWCPRLLSTEEVLRLWYRCKCVFVSVCDYEVQQNWRKCFFTTYTHVRIGFFKSGGSREKGAWVKNQFPESRFPAISVRDVCGVGWSENMLVALLSHHIPVSSF